MSDKKMTRKHIGISDLFVGYVIVVSSFIALIVTGVQLTSDYVRELNSIEAQLLSIADRFEEMTCVEEGKKMMSPTEAIEQFKEEAKAEVPASG